MGQNSERRLKDFYGKKDLDSNTSSEYYENYEDEALIAKLIESMFAKKKTVMEI